MIGHAVTGARAERQVVVVGSDHSRSPYIRVLVEETARALKTAGVEPVDWDVDRDPGCALAAAIRSAGAMVLVTPLVHNSYSGRLKTALDDLAPRELDGMPVGLMATREDEQDPLALDHLRSVVRSLDGRAVPGQVVATADDFTPVDLARWRGGPQLRDRIANLLGELLWFVDRFPRTRGGAWEGAVPGEPSGAGRPSGAGAEAGRRAVPAAVAAGGVLDAVPAAPASRGAAACSTAVPSATVSTLPVPDDAPPAPWAVPVAPDAPPDVPPVEPQPGSPGAPLADTASRGVALAIAYIRANFTDPELSLNAAAKAACMSRYHFSRTFKAQTGLRYIDFVARLRLLRARMLLLETDKPVSAICHAAGFGDLSHFERTFKRWFEVSPSQYRSLRAARPGR